ncbi:hypothetical protein ACK3ZI_04165 [Aeromonas caviae]|uniref:hypothetical protein n=1 Tax=Aeromonas caviae TaxID=648 RepID=UPI0015DD0FEA|nr:hypothetical protein [Aeromonas caviae]BBS17737.1 hypothetical protein WP5W18E02_27740 [Aeromonas caviae]
MANKRQIADERDYAAMGVNELLRGLDLFVEPLGEIERLEVEGQKEASGFAHHGDLSRPVTKMASTLPRLKFARQGDLGMKHPAHGQSGHDSLGSDHPFTPRHASLIP